jgi:hypothetical protein
VSQNKASATLHPGYGHCVMAAINAAIRRCLVNKDVTDR